MDEIDDDYEFDNEAHELFVNAVSKLDKTQHIKQPTRNEPTNLTSEFNLIKSSNKIDINNVVKVLKSNAHQVQISKKLKKTQESSNILKRPLEKPQAERLKRSSGYQQTKERVGRWDAVVARNRTDDCIYFPLKRASNKLLQTDEILSKYEMKSPLELELENIDPPQLEAEEEDDPVYPMTYQEMIEQRQHLAKVRAQQSFSAAKAKRQSKIKSKKYHRILKKEKLKQQLKEFEELQKTDPEEALKRLEALEKERALERHTLRHKNTGKWAKSKLVRAKYDKETRQQLAEQLSISRNLTKKTGDNESSDDERNNETILDVKLAQDPFNPWMIMRHDKSNVDAEFDFGYKKYVNQKKLNNADNESDSDNDVSKISENTCDSVVPVADKVFVLKNINDNHEIKICSKKPHITKSSLNIKNTSNTKINLPGHLVSTTNWSIDIIDDDLSTNNQPSKDISNAFESLETNISKQVTMKLKHIRENLENQNRNKIKKNKVEKEKSPDNIEYLQFKNNNKKAIIDEQLNETSSNKYGDDDKDTEISLKMIANQAINQKQTTNIKAPVDDIDPNRFIKAKPKYLNTTINNAVNNLDDLDDDEQVVPKANIEDIFEEDDVVDSFRQEKEDEANKDNPKDIDLSLPGWGSWGGKGVVPSRKRKNNRFILKGAPKMPRRDENKGDIIIKEYKEPKLASHKITQVPFPFTSVKDFEASIRAPLGNTFIPERAHAKLIKPSVVTKAGTIIEAMDEDELLLPRNIRYKNQSVIDLLAKNRGQNSKEFIKRKS